MYINLAIFLRHDTLLRLTELFKSSIKSEKLRELTQRGKLGEEKIINKRILWVAVVRRSLFSRPLPLVSSQLQIFNFPLAGQGRLLCRLVVVYPLWGSKTSANKQFPLSVAISFPFHVQQLFCFPPVVLTFEQSSIFHKLTRDDSGSIYTFFWENEFNDNGMRWCCGEETLEIIMLKSHSTPIQFTRQMSNPICSGESSISFLEKALKAWNILSLKFRTSRWNIRYKLIAIKSEIFHNFHSRWLAAVNCAFFVHFSFHMKTLSRAYRIKNVHIHELRGKNAVFIFTRNIKIIFFNVLFCMMKNQREKWLKNLEFRVLWFWSSLNFLLMLN